MTLTEFHERAVSVCRKYMPQVIIIHLSVCAIISYDEPSYTCSYFNGALTIYAASKPSPQAALESFEAELQKRESLNNISKQQEDIEI